MRRAFAAFTSVALLATLVAAGPGPAVGDEPGAQLVVNPGEDWIEGWYFTPGATVSIERNGEQIDDGSLSVDGDPGMFTFYPEEIDIVAGDTIVVSDGTLQKGHIVTGLEITGIDGNVVSGTASGPTVHLWVDGTDVDRVLTVEGGSWVIDVSAGEDGQATVELERGMAVHADEADGDGDTTRASWYIPDPRFAAAINGDNVMGWGFGGLVTVSILDPQTGLSDTWAADEIEQDGSGSFSLYLDPRSTAHTWDLLPGQTVTVTGPGGLSRELVIADLAITGYDLEQDTITGTADETLGLLYLDVTREGVGDGGPEWDVAVQDVGATWTVGLVADGGPLDLRILDEARAKQPDSDGDETWAYRRLAPPRFSFAAELQEVVGYGWNGGSTVTLTVDHPDTQASPDLTVQATAGQDGLPETFIPSAGGEIDVYVDLARAGDGTFRARAGDTMTMTDGETVKTQLIPDLRVNLPADPQGITGSTTVPMPDGSVLWGWPDVVPSPADGSWEFSFDEEVARPGAWAIQMDVDGDQAAVSEPFPRIWVDPQADRVWAIDFGGPSVTLTVARPGAADQQREAPTQNIIYGGWEPVDMWAKPTGTQARPLVALFDLAGDIDIVAGDTLTAADGVSAAEKAVGLCSVDSVDASSDTLSGRATSGSPVALHIGADRGGYWGYSVTPVDDQWSYHFDPGEFPNQGLDPGMTGQAFCDDFSVVVLWEVPSGVETSTSIVRDLPDPTVVGQPYLVNVLVERTGAGSGRPAGAVTVHDGHDASCTDTTSTRIDGHTSSFSCVLRSLAAGARTLTATFDPAAGWAASAGTATHLVKRAATSTRITNARSLFVKPTRVGEAFVVAVKVSTLKPGSGIPGGTVTITDGSATCTVASLSAVGTGSCSLTSTSAGWKTITARYHGSVDFLASTATVLHRVRAV